MAGKVDLETSIRHTYKIIRDYERYGVDIASLQDRQALDLTPRLPSRYTPPEQSGTLC